MIIKGITRRGRWTYDAEKNTATGEVIIYDRDGQNPKVADWNAARLFQPDREQATYRPARDLFEGFRETATTARAEFYQRETILLGGMTKAQLMATGDVAIHESYSKAELLDDALRHRWANQAEAQEYDRLMHLESRESEIFDNIEKIQGKLAEALKVVEELALVGTDLSSLDDAMHQVRQFRVQADLWSQVADLIGPDGREPLDAIRIVAQEATGRAMDALEDNSRDLFAHRITARWIRRNEHLIKALEYYR